MSGEVCEDCGQSEHTGPEQVVRCQERLIQSLRNEREDLRGGLELAEAQLASAQAELAERKWIPVGERMPRDREPVLFAADATYCGSLHVKICPCGGPRCLTELDPPEWRLETEDQELVLGVTHWMPLPEPPKASET